MRVISEIWNLQQPVVEIGSYRYPFQDELANLRPLFPNKEFIGCDMRKGLGVDKIENVEALTFPDRSVGTVIILNTIEHVENNFNAFNEIHRVLKDDGMVIVTCPMDIAIHDAPGDYWRFTPQALNVLMRMFPYRITGFEGDPERPIQVYGVGIKSQDGQKCNAFFEHLTQRYLDNFNIVDRIKYKYCLAKSFAARWLRSSPHRLAPVFQKGQ